MEKTPISMRKHIALVGKTNAGKSTLFNALLGQETSIVSDTHGTTTDPVLRAMELIPYGPVTLIDTAGLGDGTTLGSLRMKKTKDVLSRADLILYVTDINSDDKMQLDTDIPSVRVYTKCDTVSDDVIERKKSENQDAVFVSDYSEDGLAKLRARMTAELEKQEEESETLFGNILPHGANIIMVIPIDSAAPKGRIILPQVQAIRDCLDNKMKAFVTQVDTLADALSEISHTDLVVTDSQAFKEVAKIVPENIPLTSFSMLLAKQKGRIRQLIDGTRVIQNLNDGDNILMLEACTHSTTHEDIGKVKIPSLLKKHTGKNLNFVYYTGYDFPENIEDYKLAIQCGGCMINRREIQSRLKIFAEKNISVTNYGVVLAYLSGILDRAKEIFMQANTK